MPAEFSDSEHHWICFSARARVLIYNKNLVAEAHARGIRVIVDVVCNHMGTLITSSDAGWPAYKYPAGFFADQLHDVLQELPAWLWPAARAKRTYVNQVLARAEVHGSYQPARRLWVRTKNGHYFPNPGMQLRSGDGWQPVYEQLALNWIDRGCGREIDHRPRPSESIQWAREALTRVAEPEPPAAEPDGQQRLF